MNLGLGNLYELKRHLLSESMRAQTSYDAAISSIGSGVAGQFDKYANRGFQRLAGATVEFSGDRDHYYLPRYPIEAITLIEQRFTLTDGWVPVPVEAVILNRDDAIGLVHFYAQYLHYSVRLRVTYTGGYWMECLEPGEEGYPTEQPAGSTALPADVKLAWCLQCGRVWAAIDKLGVAIAQEEKVIPTLAGLELLGEVKQVLDAHKRFMLT